MSQLRLQMRPRPTWDVAVFLVAAAALAGCGGVQQPELVIHGEALGTFYTVRVVAPPDGVDLTTARALCDDALERVNTLMSTYREDSELSRFNRHFAHTPFQLSADTFAVFEIAQQVARESGGAFDITVGPLVNAWGFGPDDRDNPPGDDEIDALLERVGYDKITLHPEVLAVSKSHPEVYCDLSGVAKGYAVDAIARSFEAAGITRYMAEVGGEIRTAGRNAHDGLWRLGIERPSSGARELQRVVHMGAAALATSGDYRNMREIEGRLYSHTIDPKTGRPVQHNLASVSVIHASCAWADAYATALMAMGPQLARQLADELGLAAMFLVHDHESGVFVEHVTPAFSMHYE